MRAGAIGMANARCRGRQRSNRLGYRVAVITALVVALLAAIPGSARVASADGSPSISTTPVLQPAFDPLITDYTARCGTSLTAPGAVTVSVNAPAGTTVSVAGAAPKSGAFTAELERAWDQSFSFVVKTAPAAPSTFYVRCMPSDMPTLTAIRSGTPGSDYYLLNAIKATSPGGAGGFSTHYLEIVDTHGVPLWWHDAGVRVADTKVLPNGNIAWITDTNGDVARTQKAASSRGLTQMPASGSPRTYLQVPDNPPADAHDFELLPNGDYLLESYAKVSGVNLASIGGLSNTCIIDSEVEEVTPSGQRVWSWFASRHFSPSEINVDMQATVAKSTCAKPEDAWHLNSLDPIGGDFLTSMRYTDAAYRINIATGDVVWKLGGSATPRSLTIIGDPFAGVIGQHDARMWPDGSVSLFDNGTDGSGVIVRSARVVRYQIDAGAGTATMVEQIQEPMITGAAFCCGSARRLPNGNWAIGYGQLGVNAEVSSSGSRVLSLNFNDPSTDPNAPAPTLFSYRMTPVTPGILTAARLRGGMDAMHTPAPSTPSAVPLGNGGAKVIWKAPARNATAPVTGYVVTPYLGTVAQPAHIFTSTATAQRITGLKNGKSYQFAVAATVAGGTGLKSAKGGSVVVGAPGQTGKPIAARTAKGALTVTFAPALGNGAKVILYTVGCIPITGGPATTSTGKKPRVTVTGLAPGKRYTCAAKATNIRGTGPGSQRSAPTTA
jgi:hypothetical protein